jgi:hypothetical protein
MTSRALEVLRADSEDLYYSDAKNACVQSIPVEYNTRFTQTLSNLGAGSSTFIIPPGNGLRCPVLVLGYSASAISSYTPPSGPAVTNTGLYALPRGWGYLAIARISWRVGGSTQYFLTGQQLLQRNLRMVQTKSQADAVLSLGGNEAKVTLDFQQDQFAYIPLTCWSGPSVDGISLPLPGDILSQNVQITVELNPSSAFWVTNPTPGSPTPLVTGFVPSAFTTGYFQAEQLVMVDRAQSLANNEAFARGEVSYSMPVSFDQQEQVITGLQATTAQQPITLTGFRAGQVKSIEMWLVDKRSSNLNKLLWKKPKSVILSYAGVIYAQYENGVSALFNLIDGTKPSAVDESALAQGAVPGAMTSSAVSSEWVSLPFAQKSGADYSDDVLVHGKEITNGIVNIQIALPDAAADGGSSAYEVHVVYNYTAALNFARGTAEYVF